MERTPEDWARYLIWIRPPAEWTLSRVRLEMDVATAGIPSAKQLTQLAKQVFAEIQALKS